MPTLIKSKKSSPIKVLASFGHEFSLLSHYKNVAGIDEAGRGALAGPVVAAIVSINKKYIPILEINDSKKLTYKKRKELFSAINTSEGLEWGVGIATNQEIDTLGIKQANYMAMLRAYWSLTRKPDMILVDGTTSSVKPLPLDNTYYFVHGDARIHVIALASIIAKVYRDTLMERFDPIYPEYGFAKHMGYGTVEHRSNILKFGPSEIHRSTFIRRIVGR